MNYGDWQKTLDALFTAEISLDSILCENNNEDNIQGYAAVKEALQKEIVACAASGSPSMASDWFIWEKKPYYSGLRTLAPCVVDWECKPR